MYIYFMFNVQVRLEIRNRWAHCDFTEWNSGMYNWSLQKIEDFIYFLHLNKPEESQAIRDLNKWKTNGNKKYLIRQFHSFFQSYRILLVMIYFGYINFIKTKLITKTFLFTVV